MIPSFLLLQLHFFWLSDTFIRDPVGFCFFYCFILHKWHKLSLKANVKKKNLQSWLIPAATQIHAHTVKKENLQRAFDFMEIWIEDILLVKQAWFTAFLLQLNPQNLSRNESCRRFGMVYLLSIAEQGLLGELIHRKNANCTFVLAVCFSSRHTGSLLHASRCILLVSAFLFHQEDHNGAKKNPFYLFQSWNPSFLWGKAFQIKTLVWEGMHEQSKVSLFEAKIPTPVTFIHNL